MTGWTMQVMLYEMVLRCDAVQARVLHEHERFGVQSISYASLFKEVCLRNENYKFVSNVIALPHGARWQDGAGQYHDCEPCCFVPFTAGLAFTYLAAVILYGCEPPSSHIFKQLRNGSSLIASL